jgi:hypothetical protein
MVAAEVQAAALIGGESGTAETTARCDTLAAPLSGDRREWVAGFPDSDAGQINAIRARYVHATLGRASVPGRGHRR